MMKICVGRLRPLLITLVLPLGLATCIYLPHPCPPSPFEAAASYDWMINDRHYSEPLNTWVRNDNLARFLRRAYRSGGIDALRSQYGFACVPRAITPACSDCYSCTLSFPKMPADQEDIGRGCYTVGEMLMQVDIGPGPDSFSVMTNWQRRKLGPDAGKF